MIESVEDWPNHPLAEWRETMVIAKEAGWTFVTARGHIFGTLSCPAELCTRKVFKSGKGAENVARDTRRLIEKCPHRPEVESAVIRVTLLLANADRLTSGVEVLIRRGQLDAEIEELLTEATQQLDEAESIARQFDEAVRLSGQLEQDAAEVLQGVSAVEAMGSASASLRQARLELRSVPTRVPEKDGLRRRLSQLEVRADRLRALLRSELDS